MAARAPVRPMRGWTWVAALAAMAAGCLAAEEPPPEEILETTCDAALPACCFDCGECTLESSSLCAWSEPPAPVREAWTHRGSSGTAVCPLLPVRAAFGHCVFLQPPEGTPPELAAQGPPLSLHANVTSPSGTASAQEAYLSLLVDMGDGWTWDPEREPGYSGALPAVLDWDLSAYPAGTRFQLWVETGVAAAAPGPTGAWVVAPMEVEASGEFVWLPPA